MEGIDILSLDKSRLEEYITSIGHKAFRAKQIFSWLHEKKVRSFDEMSNISKELRETLSKQCYIDYPKIIKTMTSQIDGTKKYLFEMNDGSLVESVFMIYHHGNSVCISSQVGCRMGCTFCASTIGGLKRNLSASQMLTQIYAIEQDTQKKISNVVVMGTGEPLENMDNLLKFISIICDEDGFNLSQRSITVSTCGLADKIRELAKSKLQITLALSLHAPDQKLREQIMPIARKYSLDEVMDACRYYFDKTGRRITFEYSLIKGVNDSLQCAKKLIALVRGFNCHINLIPVNPVRETGYLRPDKSGANKFLETLKKNNINATLRREMGTDIDGACGQLRKRHIEEEI